jgi:hypothetical protein
LTKADILNKRRFASISIKNCFADVKENDGPVLGDPRRWRKLWHCHFLSFSRMSGRSGVCRSDALKITTWTKEYWSALHPYTWAALT